MPHEGRVSGNCPERSNKELERSGVGCAAGQAHVLSNKGHPGDMRLKKPIADEDREALKRLVEVGRMIRRTDGRYGTAREPMITQGIVARLKQRDLAVSGFDRKSIAASDKGRRLYAEMKTNAP